MADYGSMVLPDAPEGTPVSNFVHLHVHSDYSILDGQAKIDKLVGRAKQLRMPALALTDHGNMFGVLNFEHLCHCNGINPIVGCEFYVAYGSHLEQNRAPYGKNGKGCKYFHLILLCQNDTGYKNMCWLNSIGYTEGTAFGKPRIDFELLQKYHEGIICCTACIQGEIPQLLMAGLDEEAYQVAAKYRDLFGPDHYYIELQNHGLEDQLEVTPKLIKLAKDLNIPLVLTNDIHYLNKEDAEAQDALRCIAFGNKLYEPHQTMGEGKSEWYFKTEDEMRQVLKGIQGVDDSIIQEAMDNTVKIANMCDLHIHQYSTQELKGTLPRFELPKEYQRHGDDYQKNQNDYVRHLVEEGLRKRYKEITPEIRERMEYEIGIIFSMGFSGYFLIVWEFINWSKSTWDNVNNREKPYMPIGPGRGSGAGSLVAYCLGITDIDPFRYGLIFERFLNPERVSMPDFDVDMDFDFRQDIIQHTRDLYHDENVGHIVTFGTLKPKNCLADVGRILGIPLSDVARLKECVPDNPKAKLKDCFTEPDEKHPDNGKLIPYKDDPAYKKLFELALKLEGCIRNTGLHASGMVIGLTPLPDWAPVYKDAKTGETAVQYTMDIIEPCGLVKFDYLGLKTLSIIRYAEDIINRHKAPDEPEFICANVSETDEKTFDLFCRGDSVAIFQFESPGMQKILRDCQPRCIEELVALNALYRPGPLDYIPKYIEGKWKPETVKYPDDSLEDLLKETYGVMVYQEQVMKVAQIISGFSLGGADMLRRAMGKKKKEVLDAKKVDFVEGALKNGHSKEHAEEIFDIMVPFAGYGFNKSHAAAYSVLAYRTGYLKANRPAEYMAANLTNEITSTDTLPVYIEEARRMGIPVDPPDVNRSDINFDVVDGHIIFGLRGIKGMGTEAARQIVEERKKNGPYKTFVDFIDRCAVDKINKKAVEVLIKTGGFDNLDQNRATLMLNFERCIEYESKIMSEKNDKQGNLFEMAGIKDYADFEFQQVEDWPKMQKLNAEAELIGCFVSGHPLDEWKEPMEKFATINSKNFERLAKITHQQKETMKANKVPFKEIRNAGTKYIAIGMLKNLHEITTSKGSQMAFGKLEDFNDSIDLVFFPDTWAAVKTHIREDGVYAFSGKADLNQKGQPNFTIEGLEDFEKLELSSIKSIHIQIKPGTSDRQKLGFLEDLLYSSNGNCTVVFHEECSGKIWTLNTKLQIDCNKDFLHKIKDNLLVEDVWCE